MKSVCHFPPMNRLCLYFVLLLIVAVFLSLSFLLLIKWSVFCFLFVFFSQLLEFVFFPPPPPPSTYIPGVHTSPAYTLHICHNCKPCSVWRGSEKHTAKDGADKDTWSLDGHSMASASRDGSALCSILETSTEEWQMVSGEACAVVRFRHTSFIIHSFIHYYMWQS